MVLQKLAFSGKRGHLRAKSHEIKDVGNAILKAVYSITLLAISGKSGRFRAKSHEIKVVGNANLKAVHFKDRGRFH